MDILRGFIQECWRLLIEMSPYLLIGFLISGFMSVFLQKEKIYRHLSQNNFLSVFKAALFGVPLPLCSCGVIPVAAHLRREGAGKGATLSFLSSAPTTGVDSILATYALLGPVFALIRPLAALSVGILSGVLTILFDREEPAGFPTQKIETRNREKIGEKWTLKIRRVLHYGFVELIDDVGKWIVIGIVIGSAIGFLVPTELIQKYLGNPWLAYPLMLLIGIPMYVCATGAIPIASALIAEGMTPGAGLVFLIAGPATNTATISFVAGKLGKQSVFLYLISIGITAFVFGFTLDGLWSLRDLKLIHNHENLLPGIFMEGCAVVILALILFSSVKAIKKFLSHEIIADATEPVQNFLVPGMSCENCTATIKRSLHNVPEVKQVNVNLKTKTVSVSGTVDVGILKEAMNRVGYPASVQIR